MKWRDLIEIDGKTLQWEDGLFTPADPAAPPADSAIRLLTNFEGAHVGVETLPLHTREFAYVIEKRLRDSGVTDSVSQVLVHRSERQGDVARVFYTAAPAELRLRYQENVAACKEHYLIFPLASLFESWIARSGPADQVVLFLHGEVLDAIIFVAGRAVAADRIHRFGSQPSEIDRQTDNLARMLQGADKLGIRLPERCTLFQHGPQADEVAARIGERLTQSFGMQLSQAESVRAQVNGSAWTSSMPPLFSCASPVRSDVAPAARLLIAMRAAVPFAAAAMLLVNLGLLAAAGWYGVKHHSNQQKLLALGPAADTAALAAKLREAMEKSDRLKADWQPALDFVALQEQASTIPDLPTLMMDIRESAPEGIEIIEVGVVTDGGKALVALTGKSRQFRGSVTQEKEMVEALGMMGYQVVKRELEAASGDNTFKLALSWKAE